MKELLTNFFIWFYNNIPYAIPLLLVTLAYALRYTGWHVKFIPDYDAKIESLTKGNDLISAFPSTAERNRLENLLAIREHRSYTAIKRTTSIFDDIFGFKIISARALDKCIIFSLIYTPILLIISWVLIGGEKNKGWFAMPNFTNTGRFFTVTFLVILAAIAFNFTKKSTICKKLNSNKTSRVYIAIALHAIASIITIIYGIISYSLIGNESTFSVGATVISWTIITSIYISLIFYQNIFQLNKRNILFTSFINTLFILWLFVAAFFSSNDMTREEVILGLPLAMAIAFTSILTLTSSIFIALKYTAPGYAFIITATSALINSAILPSAANEIINSGKSSEEMMTLVATVVGSAIISIIIILKVIAYKIIARTYNATGGGILGGFFILLILIFYVIFIRTEIIGYLKQNSHNNHTAFIINIYVILILFPIWNGFVDMLSLATTRYLLRKYERSPRSWWWMVTIDTITSVATIVVLILGLFFLEGLSGLGSTNSTQATDTRNFIFESKSLMLWTISLGLANMIPTLIHLSLATASTWAGWILRDKEFLFHLRKTYTQEFTQTPSNLTQPKTTEPSEKKSISKSQAIALINAVKFDWIVGALLPPSLLAASLIPLWKSIVSGLIP